tara:strand:- start:192 stop:623 length:432 start_codon:yes stop_codon:yes gene_type:complete
MGEDDYSLTNMKLLMTLIGEIYCERLKELAIGKLIGTVREKEFKEGREIIRDSVVFKDIGSIVAEARVDFRYNTNWVAVEDKLLGTEKTRKRFGKEKIEKVNGLVETGFVEQDGKSYKISGKGLNRVFGYLLFIEFDRMSNEQ